MTLTVARIIKATSLTTRSCHRLTPIPNPQRTPARLCLRVWGKESATLAKGKSFEGEAYSTTAAAIGDAGEGQVSVDVSGCFRESDGVDKQQQAASDVRGGMKAVGHDCKHQDGSEGESVCKKTRRTHWADMLDEDNGSVGEIRWV